MDRPPKGPLLVADIPIQEEGEITFQSADPDGDSFINDGNTQIQVGGPTTEFTIEFQNARDCNFGVHPAYGLVVPAGLTQAISERLSPFRFNDSGSRTHITYSPSAVGIYVAAIRTPVLLTDPI